MRCIFCKGSVLETDLDHHIRLDHKIQHDRAVDMLIAMQYSEQPDIMENNVPIMNNSQEDSQVEEQVPVNESTNGLEIDMERLV